MSMAIKTDSASLTFSTFTTDAGWPEEDMVRDVEELTSAGADGSRIRIPRSDFPTTDVSVLRPSASFADALAERSQIVGMVGRIADVVISVGNEMRTYRAHVLSATALPSPGPMVSGAGLSPAHVSAKITMRIIEKITGAG